MNSVPESEHVVIFVAHFACKYAPFALAQKLGSQHKNNVPFRHPLPNFQARPLCRAFFWQVKLDR